MFHIDRHNKKYQINVNPTESLLLLLVSATRVKHIIHHFTSTPLQSWRLTLIDAGSFSPSKEALGILHNTPPHLFLHHCTADRVGDYAAYCVT